MTCSHVQVHSHVWNCTVSLLVCVMFYHCTDVTSLLALKCYCLYSIFHCFTLTLYVATLADVMTVVLAASMEEVNENKLPYNAKKIYGMSTIDQIYFDYTIAK